MKKIIKLLFFLTLLINFNNPKAIASLNIFVAGNGMKIQFCKKMFGFAFFKACIRLIVDLREKYE